MCAGPTYEGQKTTSGGGPCLLPCVEAVSLLFVSMHSGISGTLFPLALHLPHPSVGVLGLQSSTYVPGFT